MNITRALLTLEFKSFFKLNNLKKSNNNKKARNEALTKLSIWGILAICGVIFSFQIAYGLVDIGFEKLIFESITPIVSVLIFFLIIYKQFSLYKRNDYDMLMSLPLKTSQIVFAKLSMYLVQSIILSFIAYIPAGIYYGVYKGEGVLYYIMLLAIIVVVPIIPFVIALIIGTIISYISSAIKTLNNSIVKISIRILLVILFGILIGMYFIYMFNTNGNVSQEIIIKAINGTSSIYSIVGFINIILYKSNIMVFLLYITINIIIFIVSIKLTSIFFTKINLKYMESKSSGNYKIESFKMTSKFIAIMKVELKRYFSTFIYVMNTMVAGVIALVISIIILILSPENIINIIKINGIASTDFVNIVSKFMPVMIGTIFTISTTTSASISIEGKGFWLTETLPIEAKIIYLSKITVNLLISLPFAIISSIILLFKFKLTLLGVITLFLTPVSLILFISIIGLLLNIKYPKFDFQTPTEVVKQGVPVLMSLVIGILVDVLLIVSTIIFSYIGTIIVDTLFITFAVLLWKKVKKIKINSIQNE